MFGFLTGSAAIRRGERHERVAAPGAAIRITAIAWLSMSECGGTEKARRTHTEQDQVGSHGHSSRLNQKRSALRPESRKVACWHYTELCVPFAKVYPPSHPTIEVPLFRRYGQPPFSPDGFALHAR
jgi:hypothetical protein